MKTVDFYSRCDESYYLLEQLSDNVKNSLQAAPTFKALKLAEERAKLSGTISYPLFVETENMEKELIRLFKLEKPQFYPLSQFILAFQNSADAFVDLLVKEWEGQYKAGCYEPSY